ncbi:atherin-like [Bubalus bubalis]|uniref:atherin-like n=1 Tax=Bubalus bubalis TaxID=89462 RepID=UPI001D1054A0|nr:atherin-like [Bubalus bubalis]
MPLVTSPSSSSSSSTPGGRCGRKAPGARSCRGAAGAASPGPPAATGCRGAGAAFAGPARGDAGGYGGAARRPRAGVGVSERRAAASAAAAAREPRAALRSMRPAAGPARSGPTAAVPRRELFVLCVFHHRPPLREPFLAALQSPSPVQTKPGLDLFLQPAASENRVPPTSRPGEPRGPALAHGC